LNIQEILNKFAVIADLSAEEAALQTSVCEDAIAEIQANLKPDVNELENIVFLNNAAASFAFYKYTLYRLSGSGGAESFTAGAVRIKNDQKLALQLAYKVWCDAKKNISNLLIDKDFIFERILNI
jgi:hypothetical protein